MPSIAEIGGSPGGVNGGKRKREMTMEEEIDAKLASSPYHTNNISNPYAIEISPQTRHDRMLYKPRSLRPSRSLELKRQKVVFPQPDYQTGLADPFQSYPTAEICLDRRMTEMQTQTPVHSKKINLSPCHICHRKPTKKADLDSYADCEGCGKRTCYICIRECHGQGALNEGWPGNNAFGDIGDADEHNLSEALEQTEAKRPWDELNAREHKEKICSQCCLEKGIDGEVHCLGCLRSEEVG